MAAAPVLSASTLSNLARPAVLILTADIGASIAVASVRLAHSQIINQPLQRKQRGLHTSTRRHVALYHSTSPLVAPTNAIRVRINSTVAPLDQRANFWGRAFRVGRYPYGRVAPGTTEGGDRQDGAEQHFEKQMDRVTSLHEMMRRRHMEFLKKRLENDPYDVMFGWRNRMRDGRPQQMWVKASDVLKAKGAASSGSEGMDGLQQTKPQSEPSAQSIPVPHNVTSQEETTSGQHYPATQANIESSYFSVEYDPIANRMVHKTAEQISHYGQDPNTSIKFPVASSKQPKSSNKAPQAVDSHHKSSHTEASLRSEFEEYKAQRLGETDQSYVDSQQSQSQAPAEVRKPSISLPDVTQRAKLENSFQKVHSSGANGSEEIARPVVTIGAGHSTDGKPTEIPAVDRVAEYDSMLQNLSARIKDVGQRVDRLQSHGQASVNPTYEANKSIKRTKQETSSQQEAEELLRKQFGEFRALTTKPQAEIPPASSNPVSFRQLPIEEQASASAATVAQPASNSVYEILAFDPVTSEVNSTTISAPITSKEASIALSEALARLAEPAKFLPHLRLLQMEGYEPVAATKNMLILRGAPIKIDASETATSSIPTQNTVPKASGSKLKHDSDYFGYPYELSRHQKRRGWRRRRLFRRVIFFGAVTGAVVYISGQRRGSRNESDSSGENKINWRRNTSEEWATPGRRSPSGPRDPPGKKIRARDYDV